MLTPPLQVGIGLRRSHWRSVISGSAVDLTPVSLLEVHSENFFADGGAALVILEQARDRFPLSLHGVGLGLGNPHGPDDRHLRRLAALVNRFEPQLVSDHLCWNRAHASAAVHNDLLPLPYSRTALQVLSDNIDRVQQRLRRPLLIENTSAYLGWRDDELSEFDFIAELVRCSGCLVLLDVNNLHVNAVNFGADPLRGLAALPADAVAQMHLAGHRVTPQGLLDDHGSRVAPPVWALFDAALVRFGAVPVIIEWDTDVPPLAVLVDEARHAMAAMTAISATPAAMAGDNGALAIATRAAAAPTGRAALVTARQALSSRLAALEDALLAEPPDAFAAETLAALRPGDASSMRESVARYRDNLQGGLHAALRAQYPVVEQLVGPAWFASMAAAYGRACPSRDGDLNQRGHALAEFLDKHAPPTAPPYLADLARLEWAVHVASSAADPAMDDVQPETMAPDDMSSHDNEGNHDNENKHDHQHQVLQVLQRPGSAVLWSKEPIASIWLAHQLNPTLRLVDVTNAAEGAVVYREGVEVKVAHLPADHAQALQAALAGVISDRFS